MSKHKRGSSIKGSARRRTLNATEATHPVQGAGFGEQDPKRRFGNFMTAGEHSRKGGRTTGIVGQTKRHFRTNNKLK